MRSETLINAIRCYLQAGEYAEECRREGNDEYASADQLQVAKQNLEAQLRQHEARQQTGERIHKLLVAVHDAEHDGAVVNVAGKLAAQLQARLTIIHVIEPVAGYSPEMGYASMADFEHTRHAAYALLDEFQARLPEGVESDRMLREGDAAMQILDAAKEARADMIIMGTHGPGRLEQLLMGSTASAVIKRACCPVIIVNRHVLPEMASKQATAQHEEPVLTSANA